jgi:hypothetical protein
MSLGGNGLPHVPTDAVWDSLEANVVVLRDGQWGKPLVVVSLDLLYVGSYLRDAIVAKLDNALPQAQLFLAASHTHRAPMTDPSKPALGECNLAYVDEVAVRTAQLIREVLDSSASLVQVSSGSGQLDSGIHRRRRRLATLDASGLHVRPTIMGPNPAVRFDSAAHRLRFMSGERVVAEIWTTALHPTGFPDPLKVSADFPGIVRQALRKQERSNHAVLFLQGFSGDVRPNSGVVKFGFKRLLLGPIFASFSSDSYAQWVGDLCRAVLQVPMTQCASLPLASSRLPVSAGDWLIGAPDPDLGAIHAIRVGDTVIVGVPGEVTNRYVEYLEPTRPGDRVWGVGCVDHVWGYLPTRAMLKEGGYEARSFCSAFGVGYVSPAIEENLGAALLRAGAAV